MIAHASVEMMAQLKKTEIIIKHGGDDAIVAAFVHLLVLLLAFAGHPVANRTLQSIVAT